MSTRSMVYKQISRSILVALIATSGLVFLTPFSPVGLPIGVAFLGLFLPILLAAVILLLPIGFILAIFARQRVLLGLYVLFAITFFTAIYWLFWI